MRKNYDILMCSCEYYDPPCDFCCSDPIVVCYDFNPRRAIRQSEAIALAKGDKK